MGYKPNYLDYEQSPYTGLTRESWIDAGKYLLSGIFSQLRDKDAPIVLERSETKITYPHMDAAKNKRRAQQKAEIFEGLCRSFFIASVLIREEPKLSIAGIGIRSYYMEHILRCVADKESPEYVGSRQEIEELTGDSDLFLPYQQTVETGGLVIGLFMSREVIWERYSKKEQDAVAAF